MCFWRLPPPPPAAFKVFLFVFGFLQFHVDVSRCGFLFIYPEWDCKEFLILWIDVFISSGKISTIISSAVASTPFFFCFPSGTPLNVSLTFSLHTLSLLFYIYYPSLCFILETSDLPSSSFILYVLSAVKSIKCVPNFIFQF